ncbi:hypothetical protein EDB86DRAFT_2834525 [Lactarius hatsudake]|nr:hypothetical protein EDB86DRAFT_2834525 [Lactarius hatsudake]
MSLKFATAAVTAAARGGEVSGVSRLPSNPQVSSPSTFARKKLLHGSGVECRIARRGGSVGGSYERKGQPEEKRFLARNLKDEWLQHVSREWAQTQAQAATMIRSLIETNEQNKG